MIFEIILTIALCLLMLAIMANLYRVIKGPSSADRVQALDSIGINLIASIAVFSVLLHTHAFFDLILLIGILSFIGTVAFARFIERGVVIERKQ
ncbi:Na(+)/H(+) antiporter subunit F1 [Paenibacillus motobuensis]|uniref:Na(+)/H(+) antiporter subunit F1 n=1 Tax=Paenibacillus lutimineralis TaxID=2707005 RepID=A0A3Q9I5P4_9BACL|nr:MULTISPECIES: Na(+)/H(+) antiporter subunit F1 [Paenibacillus]AZS13254.1 Na(+)/H(+) antiporter subunit F1 [Paenibacillus lutimineralis]MCM3041468.1 Na(+)/H(+) antiporter subunit F1 [Paenibacillus lutimineralis]MCM3648572.1 Na(+)/H(+) antiporter subunit F1 [Paenibacillus motobuensis]NWL86076.1 Na(+)/H(+) antiporter subunit F1 [Paenibacillus sp. 79R4]